MDYHSPMATRYYSTLLLSRRLYIKILNLWHVFLNLALNSILISRDGTNIVWFQVAGSKSFVSLKYYIYKEQLGAAEHK